MSSIPHRLRTLGIVGVVAMTFPMLSVSHMTPTVHATAAAIRIQGTSAGSQAAFPTTVVGSADMTSTEFPKSDNGDDAGAVPVSVDRTLGVSKGQGRVGVGAARAKSNPAQVLSFEGLNHYQSRTAYGGNQFSLEPPDQALCAGNGYVVEGVNDAIAVYDRTGKTVAGPAALNEFYGFAPAINRTSGVYGNELTDPVCYFDPASQHFYFVVLTLNLHTNGAWYGNNELDFAVSKTANPTAGWNFYRLDVSGLGPKDCPCLADYPHIGADANGIYVTVNDFPLYGPGVNTGYNAGFNESDIYALSKQDLLKGNLDGWLLRTDGAIDGDPGFTVWPATAPGGKYETAAGGTEYFMSSTLDACSACSGTDNRVAVWALTHTNMLTSPTSGPTLSHTMVQIQPYAEPPLATQPSGDNPTGYFYEGADASQVGPIATNDSRNLNAIFANGKLWGAFTTDVTVNGSDEAGIAYFIVKPVISSAGQLSATLALQGTLAAPNASLIFPSIGVTPSGRGVMTYTLTGPSDFPSAAYSSLDAKAGAGPIVVAAAGQGPQDGFTEYGGGARWGDYGATATDGSTIWVASEYIAHGCSFATFAGDTTCGKTRTSLANWSTRVTELNLGS